MRTQGNSAVIGQSGLVTVSANVADLLVKVSGDAAGLTAGTERDLQARVTDSFGNVVSGDGLRFIVRSGGGDFSGLDSIDVVTGSGGLALATLSTGIVPGTNTVTALRIADRCGQHTVYDYHGIGRRELLYAYSIG